MRIPESEIYRVVDGIWRSVLRLGVGEHCPAEPAGLPVISSLVRVHGAWEGSISLECPVPLARRAASIMFGIEVEEVASEELHDAMGELANMVGGHLKAMLPGPSRLSGPQVRDAPAPVAEAIGEARTCLECEGLRLVVTVREGTT